MADNETPPVTPTPETPKLHPVQVGANIVVKGLEGFLRGLGVNAPGLGDIPHAFDRPRQGDHEHKGVSEAVVDVDLQDFDKIEGERSVEDAVKEVGRTDTKDVVKAIEVLDKSFIALANYVQTGFGQVRAKFDEHAEAVTKISKGNQQLVKLYNELGNRLKDLEVQTNLDSKKNLNDDIEKANLRKKLADLENQIKNMPKGDGGSGWGGFAGAGLGSLLGGAFAGGASVLPFSFLSLLKGWQSKEELDKQIKLLPPEQQQAILKELEKERNKEAEDKKKYGPNDPLNLERFLDPFQLGRKFNKYRPEILGGGAAGAVGLGALKLGAFGGWGATAASGATTATATATTATGATASSGFLSGLYPWLPGIGLAAGATAGGAWAIKEQGLGPLLGLGSLTTPQGEKVPGFFPRLFGAGIPERPKIPKPEDATKESILTEKPDIDVEKRNITLTAKETLILKATNEVNMTARSLKIETEEVKIDTQRFILSPTALDALKSVLATNQVQQQWDDKKPNLWQKFKGWMGLGPQYTPSGQRIPSGLEMLGQGTGLLTPPGVGLGQIERTEGGFRTREHRDIQTWIPNSGQNLLDESGKPIDPQTMADIEAAGKRGDINAIQKITAERGYRMSGPACGIIASKYAQAAGFAPPKGGSIATTWHTWGESLNPADINKEGHPFGSMVGTYYHGRYGGAQGRLLSPGETGGHVMHIVPGTYDEKDKSAVFIDQYGAKRRKLSDIDLRFAGADVVDKVRTVQGEQRGGNQQTVSSNQQQVAARIFDADDKTGRVHPETLYKAAVDRFTNSRLNGYVPADGEKWGITKGTPQEWARLAVALARQESSLNANAPNGGLYQFNPVDLARYGLPPNAGGDPMVSLEAMARQFERYIPAAGSISGQGGGPGSYGGWKGAAAYFEPFRTGAIYKHMQFADQVGKSSGYAGPQIAQQQQPDATKMQQPVTAEMPGGGYIQRGIQAADKFIDKAVEKVSNFLNPPKTAGQRVAEGFDAFKEPETVAKLQPKEQDALQEANRRAAQLPDTTYQEELPGGGGYQEKAAKADATLQESQTESKINSMVPAPEYPPKSGEQITGEVKKEADKDALRNEGKRRLATGESKFPPGYGPITGSPRHSSDSYGPTPGSDGYGDGKENPDGGGGICAI